MTGVSLEELRDLGVRFVVSREPVRGLGPPVFNNGCAIHEIRGRREYAWLSPALAGTVAVAAVASGSAELIVSTKSSATVVVNESWVHGWRAEEDLARLQVGQMDGFRMGIRIPAGRHRIVLCYHPPAVGLGLLLGCVGSSARLACGAAGGRMKSKRRRGRSRKEMR